MSDWCPENDGAYQAEMAERFRRGEVERIRAAREQGRREGLEEALEIVKIEANHFTSAKEDCEANGVFPPEWVDDGLCVTSRITTNISKKIDQ